MWPTCPTCDLPFIPIAVVVDETYPGHITTHQSSYDCVSCFETRFNALITEIIDEERAATNNS